LFRLALRRDLELGHSGLPEQVLIDNTTIPRARHHTRSDGALTRITDQVSSSLTVESPNV
jgi:hypothetical protein